VAAPSPDAAELAFEMSDTGVQGTGCVGRIVGSPGLSGRSAHVTPATLTRPHNTGRLDARAYPVPMALRESVQKRRLFPRARWLAKQMLVRWDLFTHRHDESVRRWRPALVGARSGHVVVPSVAIESSRREAGDFAARGLVRAGDRVLDIGAGNGRQAIGLVEQGVASYTGLEIVKGSVEYANAAFASQGNVRLDWFDVQNAMYNPNGSQQPEKATFPYPDGSFDFAVALSLYTHLERLAVVERYVSETARVLRAGGTAFMTFFRSPPNEPSASAVRTVFGEADIRRVVGECFEIEDAAGCETTAFHDQWRLYLRKR